MKIIVTSNGKETNDSVDPRFGRAAFFLVFDSEGGSPEVHDNKQNLNAAQGAGIQTAQNVAATGTKIVITGHCGPKAFRILSASKITVYLAENGSVQNALDLFEKDGLTEIKAADVEGHWA